MKKVLVLSSLIMLGAVSFSACGGGGTPPSSDSNTSLGSVAVTITNSGIGTGKSGDLKVMVKECGGAILAMDNSRTSVVLSAVINVPAITSIPIGTKCVYAFLDVDLNGLLNMADIVPSSGQSSVAVVSGATTTATINLDQLQT